jgi:hypothetical protein
MVEVKVMVTMGKDTRSWIAGVVRYYNEEGLGRDVYGGPFCKRLPLYIMSPFTGSHIASCFFFR